MDRRFLIDYLSELIRLLEYAKFPDTRTEVEKRITAVCNEIERRVSIPKELTATIQVDGKEIAKHALDNLELEKLRLRTKGI